MKKIMFNDHYGLTEAALSSRKTQTRRIAYDFRKHASNKVNKCVLLGNNNLTYKVGEVQVLDELLKPRYHIGEIVAIAQSYKDAGHDSDKPLVDTNGVGFYKKAKLAHGWNNKMFVQSALMPHHIRITNVRVERMQDISDEDCINEGVETMESYIVETDGTKKILNYYRLTYRCKSGRIVTLSGSTPREVYHTLIDRISGKGTWESNPFVFAYDFELVD